MRLPQRATLFLAAAAAGALCLGGCAAEDRGTAASPGPVTAAGTAEATGTAEAVPPSPEPSRAVAYTFPDGRLSFTHPAGWRVEHDRVSASPSVEIATVLDDGGKQQINIYYSQVGDAGAGPAARFVLEVDPVPGLVGRAVPTPHSSFYVDHVNGAVQYRLGLTAGLPVSPDGTIQAAPIMLGDRILAADVLFTGEPFANDDAAKAWYWGAEGQTLKAVLMSFSYR